MKINFLLLLLSFMFVLPAYSADKSNPIKGKDLEKAQIMNDIYARHVLTSSCIDRQIGYFLPQGISSVEKSGRINAFKKNCDCIAETTLKNYSANDVIDYVTNTYGSVMPKTAGTKSVQNMGGDMQRQKFAKMTYLMNVDKETRKNCGFQK